MRKEMGKEKRKEETEERLGKRKEWHKRKKEGEEERGRKYGKK